MEIATTKDALISWTRGVLPPRRPNLVGRPSDLLQWRRRRRQSISVVAGAPTNESTSSPPLVVVGSANADIYMEVERLPAAGETVSAVSGWILAGGKGANQAACGGMLSHPTYLLAGVGDDGHGRMVSSALERCGVLLDHLRIVPDVPTGHAVVMLMRDGDNSIVIVGGANMCSWPPTLHQSELDLVRRAGIVLLQREIPDFVNINVAKAAKAAGVEVILDAGGMEGEVPAELLRHVDVLSPNETELARITGMDTSTFQHIAEAAAKCHLMGVKKVLVKLGARGSVLFVEGQPALSQPAIPAEKVVDTTGAGDSFTAAFAVYKAEGRPATECLKFAAAAASLCVQVKGAIPSMPDRPSVLTLLHLLS